MKKTLCNPIIKIFALAGLITTAEAQTQPCFNAQVTYGVNRYSRFVVSADFNGDGKPDLACSSNSNSPAQITVLLNTGTGTFNPPAYYYNSDSQDITSADFNGDGKPDLAVTSYGNNSVSVLLNTGTGSFNAAVNYSILGAHRITSADFNGDGKPDLAVTNYRNNSVSVLLNTGTGSFNFPVIYSVGRGLEGITSSDFNGDGKPDLAVVCNLHNSVLVLLNTGAGSFNSAVSYSVGIDPRGITSADFNGDGKPDLAVANMNNSVSMLLNTGTGSFNSAVSYGVGRDPYDITSADFNGDSKPDMAVASSGSNSLSILLNTGTGSFNSAVHYSVAGGLIGITSADFNGDGNMDISTVPWSDPGSISVLLHCATPIPPSANYSNLPTSLCLGSHVDATPSISGTPPQTYYFSNPLVSPQVDTAIAVCKNNHSVFVLFAGDSVRRYDSAGNYQFTYPYMPIGSHAIAADNNNRLFVVGPDNMNPTISSISCYDGSGNMDFTFWNGGPTTDNYILNYIAGIAIGPDGKLYAADTLADIKILSTDGSSQIASIPTPSNLQYSLYKPMSICFGKAGQMYVADAGNRNILARNTSDNNFYPVFTKIDTTWQPASVDVDTIRNNLYFTTCNIPHRVIMGNATNAFGDTLCNYDTLSSHITFASPNGLAVVNQNSWPNLWVSDNKSSTLNIVDEFTYQIAPALPPGLTFQFFGGISGTPTAPSPLTTYTLTVSNSLGTTTTTASFAVDPPGPVSNAAGLVNSSAYQTDGLTIHYFDANNCAKMLEIADQVGGGMPGSVSITQTVTPTISVFNADTFINRVTSIMAQNPNDSAHIKIYYTYLDILHYNQSLGGTVLSNDTIGGTMKVAVLQMHESPPNSGHLTPIKHGPITANWSNTEHHWVVDFKVGKFSDFYMGDTVRIGAFSCGNSHADTVNVVGNYYIWHYDSLFASGTYIDTLTNMTGCDSITILELTLNQTTNITPMLAKGVSVYPNPSTGLLNIDINDPNVEVKKIRVINMMGEEVYISDDNQRIRKVDLCNLPKGFYMVTITSSHETLTRKILVE